MKRGIGLTLILFGAAQFSWAQTKGIPDSPGTEKDLSELSLLSYAVYGGPLTVSVYNDAGVPADVLSRGEQEASRIFRQGGIKVKWLSYAEKAVIRSICICELRVRRST